MTQISAKSIVSKTILTLFLFLFCSNSFAQLVQVSLDQRIANSKVVFEGKVLSSKSFWDEKHTNIYTANVIEVYKVFKGTLTANTVEIITEGGTVGNEKETVTHTLEISKGDVGIFMCHAGTVKPSQNSGLPSFKTYADSQGFARYDLNNYTANDMFTTYNDITTKLYGEIKKRTKQEVKEITKVSFKKK
ncbi:MAG: hypothetical protein V4667_03510 [Bacteroidota bacterium]